MVVYSKGKVVTGNEVLGAGPQPQPLMETVLITLMHLALHSEKIELEVNSCLSFFFFLVFTFLQPPCVGLDLV